MRDRWIASGDVGSLNDDGYLYIEGRKRCDYLWRLEHLPLRTRERPVAFVRTWRKPRSSAVRTRSGEKPCSWRPWPSWQERHCGPGHRVRNRSPGLLQEGGNRSLRRPAPRNALRDGTEKAAVLFTLKRGQEGWRSSTHLLPPIERDYLLWAHIVLLFYCRACGERRNPTFDGMVPHFSRVVDVPLAVQQFT